ncbi:uncharacterized protein LOC135105274, partial [Scylla paramamosain]|uniref:uncharacterized protein LOC135105274 n=1 Tax=Scylla paramamosain TaxID=85552 RepID=UPI003082A93D
LRPSLTRTLLSLQLGHLSSQTRPLPTTPLTSSTRPPPTGKIDSPTSDKGLGVEVQPKKNRCRTCLRFHLTAFFTLVACFSSFAFLFLVPFIIDPAFSTIFADFDTEPRMCVTKESVSLNGASNCSWSSCREGCTKEIFECLHIYVNYRYDPEGLKNGINFTEAEEIDLETWDVYDARLYPNVKGCGYPPTVNCTTFAANYKKVGKTYPCYYSKKIPTMVLDALDIPGVKRDLVYAIVVPWGCFFVSILYIMVTYAGMRGPDEEDDKAQEVSSSKASKEASNYSLRSIGKTINHGMNKLRGEPDDKGRDGGGGGVGGGEGGGVGLGGGGLGGGGGQKWQHQQQQSPTSSSPLEPHLLLAPASLPEVLCVKRTALPPWKGPPLPRPARDPIETSFQEAELRDHRHLQQRGGE